jgi:hypothetical protein
MECTQTNSLKMGILQSPRFWAVIVALATTTLRIPFLLVNISFNNDAYRYSENIELPFMSGKYGVQLPGYISYIYLARLIRTVVPEPVAAQNVVNLLATALIGFFMFNLLQRLKLSLLESAAYTVMFSFLNVLMLGSLVGGGRLFLVLGSILSIHVALVVEREPRYLLLFAAILAFFMGFRQDLSYILLPLYVYLLIKVGNWKLAGLSLLLFAAVCLTWFVPMMMEYGGIQTYLRGMRGGIPSSVLPTSVVVHGPTATSLLNIVRLLFSVVNAFFCAIVLFLYTVLKKQYRFAKDVDVILMFAFVPAFLFNLFIHLGNFVLLTSFTTPLFLFLLRQYRLASRLRLAVCGMVIALQLFQFFGLKMIANPNYVEKIANTLWLQWTYDGAKSGQLLVFSGIKRR